MTEFGELGVYLEEATAFILEFNCWQDSCKFCALKMISSLYHCESFSGLFIVKWCLCSNEIVVTMWFQCNLAHNEWTIKDKWSW